MKILWFANTPCSAMDRLGSSAAGGGWLTALEQSLKNASGIELHIAFYYGENLQPFLLNAVYYHPVFRPGTRSKTKRYLGKLTGSKMDDKKYVSRLLTVVERVKPDLIHVHGTEENFARLQPFTPIPVIISIQGILSAYSLKYYSGVSSSVATRYEGIISRLRFKSAGYLFRKLVKDAKREGNMLIGAKYVMGRTDWDRRISRLLAPRSAYFVGNEMLRDIFYQKLWEKRPEGAIVKILTVSSDSLYKGFETIVATAGILVRLTAFRFEWTVVGIDQRSSIVRIVQNWKNENLKDLGIQLTGFKSASQIAELLLASDIYCQVSHIENSPNSLCEAMMVGMPIVASLAGGTGSLLADLEDGILVQDGDPYALAGAVMELAASRDLCLKYGTNARRKALERHNRKAILDSLLTVYNEVIEVHRTAR